MRRHAITAALLVILGAGMAEPARAFVDNRMQQKTAAEVGAAWQQTQNRTFLEPEIAKNGAAFRDAARSAGTGAFSALMRTPAGWAAIEIANILGPIIGQELAKMTTPDPPGALDETFRYSPTGAYGTITLPRSKPLTKAQFTTEWQCRADECPTCFNGDLATYATNNYMFWTYGQVVGPARVLDNANGCLQQTQFPGTSSAYSSDKVYTLTAGATQIYSAITYQPGWENNASSYVKPKLIASFTPRPTTAQGGKDAANNLTDDDFIAMLAPSGTKTDTDGNGKDDANFVGGQAVLKPSGPTIGQPTHYVASDGTVKTYTPTTEQPYPPGETGTITQPTPTPVPTPTPSTWVAPSATPYPQYSTGVVTSPDPNATPSATPTPLESGPPPQTGPVAKSNFITHPIVTLRTKFPFDWATDALVGIPNNSSQDLYWTSFQGRTYEGIHLERRWDLNWSKPIWQGLVIVAIIGLVVTAFLLL